MQPCRHLGWLKHACSITLQVFRASICVQIDMSSTPCSTRPTPAHIYTMYMSTAQEVLGPAAPTHIPTSHAAQDCTSLHICPLCIPLCPCTYTPATPHTRLHAHAHGPAACAHMACSACAHSPPPHFPCAGFMIGSHAAMQTLGVAQAFMQHDSTGF